MDTQGEKQMFKGDWKCSGCNADITQLPFQPDPSRENELTCLDCYKSKRQDGQERQIFQGKWSCSKCGGSITQLPFEPHPDRQNTLQCLDCYRK